MRNLNYGDRDSLGYFQQRPSMGWGTPEQIMDPAYALGKFLDAATPFKGQYSNTPTGLGAWAQAVQRSAFPDLYAQHWDAAAGLIGDPKYYEKGGRVPGRDGEVKGLLAHAGEIVLPQGVSDNFIKFTEWMRELVQKIRGISGAGSRAQGVRAGGASRYSSEGIDSGTISQQEWDRLIAQGWRGIPGDGREAIYPPEVWKNYTRAEDGSVVPKSFYGGTSGGQNAGRNRAETHIQESSGGSSYIVTHNGRVVASSGNASAGGAQAGNVGGGVINRGAIHRPGMDGPWQININPDNGLIEEMANMKRTLAAALRNVGLDENSRRDIREGALSTTKNFVSNREFEPYFSKQLSNITSRVNGTRGGR